jgi:hypothetical protein
MAAGRRPTVPADPRAATTCECGRTDDHSHNPRFDIPPDPPNPGGKAPVPSAAPDFGPIEVVVNDVRYVREATLFACMEQLDALLADACQDKLAESRNREARYEDALNEILAVRLDESGKQSLAHTFDEARRKMRAIAEEALRDA